LYNIDIDIISVNVCQHAFDLKKKIIIIHLKKE